MSVYNATLHRKMTMLELGAIQSALGSFKAVSDIATSMVGMKNAADINSKAIELQSQILSLQSDISAALISQMTLVKENDRLKSELAQLEDAAADLKRYKLHTPWPGSMVYAITAAMSNNEPPHYICTNCYHSGQKSILNCSPDRNGWYYMTCARCKAEVATNSMGPVPATYAPQIRI